MTLSDINPSGISFFALAFAFTLTLLTIFFVTKKISPSHGSDIRIIWYFFWLSFTCTLLIAFWATNRGAIDTKGSFNGEAGYYLSKLLNGVLDLKSAVMLYIAIVGLVIIPQALSWISSGLSGYASAPIWVNPILQFLFWGILKSFVVAAGVVSATVMYGALKGWNEFDKITICYQLTSVLGLITVSFAFLYLYRDVRGVYAKSGDSEAKERNPLAKANRFVIWMNRKNCIANDSISIEERIIRDLVYDYMRSKIAVNNISPIAPTTTTENRS